jgi:hypothetical protein
MSEQPWDEWVLFLRCAGGHQERVPALLPMSFTVSVHRDGSSRIEGLMGETVICQHCGGELEVELRYVPRLGGNPRDAELAAILERWRPRLIR